MTTTCDNPGVIVYKAPGEGQTTIDELLAARESAKTEFARIEAQRKAEESRFKSERNRLSDEIYKLQGQERELGYAYRDTEKNLYKEEGDIEKNIAGMRDQLLRPISLSSLKHILPDNYEPAPAWWGDSFAKSSTWSEVIFTTPVAGIIARIGASGKPKNMYKYRLSIIVAAGIPDYRLKNLAHFYKKDHDLILVDKDFPSLESAVHWHSRNAYKYHAEAINRITNFYEEIKAAPEDLSEAFDFRILADHEYLQMNYAHADKFKIVSIEKNRLVLSRIDYVSHLFSGSPKLVPGEIVVTRNGFDFTIEGANKEKHKRPEHYSDQPYPDYTQIRDALIDEFNLFFKPEEKEEETG